MNTEMDATPPAGYVECPKKCGRHCPPMPQQAMCWSCWDGYALPNKAEAPGARLSHPDWQPPVAGPRPKVEVKTTVDGKCPLCGVAVPSTHIHLCSPQHVERRKGQRWKDCVGETYLITDATKGAEMALHEKTGTTIQIGGIWKTDFHWEKFGTLIHDAPPEPGKSTGCRDLNDEGYACACLPTKIVTQSPPAHETPKAAPVVVCIDCDTAPIAHPVPMRFVGLVHRARPICDDCYLARETHIGDHDYTPHSGPERLRNVLARDELVEWDCLEDA